MIVEWTEQAIRQLDQARDCISLANSEEVAVQGIMHIVTAFNISLHFRCPVDRAVSAARVG